MAKGSPHVFDSLFSCTNCILRFWKFSSEHAFLLFGQSAYFYGIYAQVGLAVHLTFP